MGNAAFLGTWELTGRGAVIRLTRRADPRRATRIRSGPEPLTCGNPDATLRVLL